ncbi:MAG: hypothetical protein Q8R76_06830 [Candidatus Omnitrophota bacterium]|nr:hypothetical protein [Candidatus Omnitrophota bacterium]
MKAVFLLLAVFLSIGADYKRYGIESGIFEYRVDGQMTGTETLYFDEWGAREARYSDLVAEVEGNELPSRTLQLRQGGLFFLIDLTTKTGVVYKDMGLDMALEEAGTEVDQVAEIMLRKEGARRAGEGEFAGKVCEVWEIPLKGKGMCLWKMIPLESYMETRGIRLTSVVTHIQENVPIPEERFGIPADIKIEKARKTGPSQAPM